MTNFAHPLCVPFAFGDPTAALPRIEIMLAGLDILDRDAISHPKPGRDTWHGRRTIIRKALELNADPAKGQDMTALMLSVRDARDEAAFAALFGHFAPRVKAFLIRSGTARGLAEECTQEVMASVWTKAHLFDPARASVATWIFTIARNRRIDVLRRERRPEPEDLTWGPEAEPDQIDALALQQDSAALSRALDSLPAKQRELIEKAYFGDLSHSEIAEITGLPLGTIKSRIRLALDRLRHALA